MNRQRFDYRELARDGLFGRTSATANITDRLGMPGTGDPARVLTARVAGGLTFDVLPGRGFDIGDAHLGGTPLSWFSPVADNRPLDDPRGRAWLRRFTGGLLTTCGPTNIGPPSDDTQGLHGDASHLPASDIAYRARRDPEADEAAVELTASVEWASMFGPSLRLERTITSGVDPNGAAYLAVQDVVRNTGVVSAPVAMLYHLNLGAPLVVPGSTVRVGGSRTPELREPCTAVPEAGVLPEPSTELTEAVFEHQAPPVDADGFSNADIVRPDGALALRISWSAATLPRLYQWVFPTRGRWALGIEPATAPLFGADRDLPNQGSPMLEPGRQRLHHLTFSATAAAVG
jgi:hypothetical protein